MRRIGIRGVAAALTAAATVTAAASVPVVVEATGQPARASARPDRPAPGALDVTRLLARRHALAHLRVSRAQQRRPPHHAATPAPAAPPPTPASARAIASVLVTAHGWGDEWSCLDRLWTRESGWATTADNPQSSAYGIPQALPGHKMAAAGSDWRTNPRTQIRWGLHYIAVSYGGPCAAWAHSQHYRWY